jgi:hypothetical protein
MPEANAEWYVEKLYNYHYTEYTHQDDTFMSVFVSAKLCEVMSRGVKQKFFLLNTFPF